MYEVVYHASLTRPLALIFRLTVFHPLASNSSDSRKATRDTTKSKSETTKIATGKRTGRAPPKTTQSFMSIVVTALLVPNSAKYQMRRSTVKRCRSEETYTREKIGLSRLHCLLGHANKASLDGELRFWPCALNHWLCHFVSVPQLWSENVDTTCAPCWRL